VKRLGTIPPSDRLGLSRGEAAEYIGVSQSLFDAMVADGRMPGPKCINSRRVWSRSSIARAFADLPEAGHNRDAADPWGDAAA
jgi:excisionase family DNA binding protein